MKAARFGSTLARCARAFSIAPLPYDYDALRPHLSAETLQLHYDKHHTGYFNKLKAFAEAERPELTEKSNEELIRTEQGFVFNMAAQIFNHDFYWQSMSPNGGGEPSGALKAALEKSFGSVDAFKAQFTKEVEGHFGSGWVWLVQDENTKDLKVVSTHDAGCPLTTPGLRPLLVCDAWEHAFYVDYRNAKPEYAKNWWNVVNWGHAEKNLA